MGDFGPIVSPEWLHEHIQDSDLRIIDFRWYLMGGKGRDAYDKGHIPGAVFVDLEAVTGEGGGRHPLPTGEQFEKEMQRAGISGRKKVVAYDDVGGSVASRLWFLLRFFGHRSQAVLDMGIGPLGGLWGGQLETKEPRIARGDFHSSEPDRSGILDFEAVRKLSDVPLIDARAGERYRGEKEPIDPKAGHIPGALSAPWAENLGPDGRFKSPEELRKRFAELGIGDEKGAVAYCGSGVNATHDLLAMELAGIKNGRLYAGSWSDWSSRDAPAATGKDPG
jgi:thiosulfate/3-mercaptopyruvate sulfurtransferase